MKSIDAYWYSKNIVAWFLLPVSWVYCALVFLRKWLYEIGALKCSSLPVPVIIVGNITVGGTGKTPLLISLCDLLTSHGIKVGVISRGYRGRFSGERLVQESSTALEVGDEPFVISYRSKCPVSVGKDRVAAAKLLLEKYQCDIILSDDGLQHYKMRRDYEIVVIDTARFHGNEYCLPAGPLREPVERLKHVDLVVYHGKTDEDYCFELEFSDAVNLTTGETKPIIEFVGSKIHAVAGIGRPDRFFDDLRSSGLEIIEHPFQDHHIYSSVDLDFDDDSLVLMTEKDAVKCSFYKKDNAWYVPVSASLSTPLVSTFLRDVKHLLDV